MLYCEEYIVRIEGYYKRTKTKSWLVGRQENELYPEYAVLRDSKRSTLDNRIESAAIRRVLGEKQYINVRRAPNDELSLDFIKWVNSLE